MREELRRSNSIGNAEGIDAFLSLIFEQKMTGIEAINHACRFLLLYQLNCNLALLLFEELGIIKSTKRNISVLPEKEYLFNLSNNEIKINIAKITIDTMLKENLLDSKRVGFDSTTGVLRIPVNSIQLDGTIYSTFLQSIGCFRRFGQFFVFKNELLREDFEDKIAHQRKQMTQEELLRKLQKQQEDGELGELFVIKYEQKRLSCQAKHPKLISRVDVGAGYDILSCHSKDSTSYDRYIEVKSFRGNPHFYWSANEKRVAEVLGENYFLYLIDLEKIEKDVNEYTPTIIANPVKQLFEEDWLIEPDSFKITRIV